MLHVVFGQIILVFSEIPSCPPSESILPCFCKSDDYVTSTECDNVQGIESISHVLRNTKGLSMSYAFRNSKLGDIPSNFFNGQQSVNLHFEHCEIGSFGNRPFTGLENTLKELFILASFDKRQKDLETFPLGHLKKLELLSFELNEIKRLGNDWFKGGPTSLKELRLGANDIEELGDQAFSSLVNLQQIWLNDNSFGKLSRSMFPRPATKLELLDISYNGIEELPEDIFEDMPAVSSINVAGNKLKSVPQATWGNVWNQLEEVYFDRNEELKCDENLKWIYERKLPSILTGECTDEKHYGKELADLTLADFE